MNTNAHRAIAQRGQLNAGRSRGTRGSGGNRGSRGNGGSRGAGRGTEGQGRARAPAPRPTHFLAIPLGTHPALRTRIASFTSALLHSAPAIAGLDSTVVPDPRRAHLTLGVMALDARAERSVAGALGLLSALKADILRIVNGGEREEAPSPPTPRPLRVALDTVGVLKPQEGGGAHVLWVGPDVSALQRQGEGKGMGTGKGTGTGTDAPPGTNEALEELAKLVRVTDLIHQTFKARGFIVDTRPLKLHCTLVNTSYRRPRARNAIPFAYDAVLRSEALAAISAVRPASLSSPHTQPDATPHTQPNASAHTPDAPSHTQPDAAAHTHAGVPPRLGDVLVKVDLGTWTAREVQLCVMGSHGPENEYVSVGGIRLDTP